MINGIAEYPMRLVLVALGGKGYKEIKERKNPFFNIGRSKFTTSRNYIMPLGSAYISVINLNLYLNLYLNIKVKELLRTIRGKRQRKTVYNAPY